MVVAVLAAGCIVALGAGRVLSGAIPDAPRRVYGPSFDPRENPDYGRHAVQPPTRETFGNRTRFACLRGFEVRDDQIVGYSEEL